jgi:NAD-dependent SIR2 family protein deacetylase
VNDEEALMDTTIARAIEDAAGVIAGAHGLVIAAGAGMGVDSGLPDFRGTHGFWRAYPPYARLGLDFAAMANPEWFATDPPFAWGFYGHRMNLYRGTEPHAGFAILRRWSERMPHGAFVVTSNVDGHFQRAGFDPARIAEVHGTVHALQCTRSCGVGIFPSAPYQVQVDETTFRAAEPLPACPRCGALARPNILMFGDFEWDGSDSAAQSARLKTWLQPVAAARAPLAIVEFGAGKAVPTIRRFCEQTARQYGCTLVRINPREGDVPAGQVSIALGALEALRAIDGRISARAG